MKVFEGLRSERLAPVGKRRMLLTYARIETADVFEQRS